MGKLLCRDQKFVFVNYIARVKKTQGMLCRLIDVSKKFNLLGVLAMATLLKVQFPGRVCKIDYDYVSFIFAQDTRFQVVAYDQTLPYICYH